MGQLAKVETRTPEQIAIDVEEHLSVVFGYFNDLENSTDRLVALIPLLPDEMVLETRRYGRSLGHVGWRIEAVADAEILHRVESRQGKRDALGEGRMAAYEYAAKIAGCHEDTIRRNVQIFKNFLAPDVPELVLTSQQKLKEKGYCEAALRSPDPQQAIVLFAERKDRDPRFTTWEAKKIARAGDPATERKRVLPATGAVLLDPEKEAQWKEWVEVTTRTRKAIPELSRILVEAIKQCREHLTLPEQTVEERILFLLREDPGPTVELLADQMRIDKFKLQGILDALVEEGLVRAVKQTDDKTKLIASRGATPLIYFVHQEAGYVLRG